MSGKFDLDSYSVARAGTKADFKEQLSLEEKYIARCRVDWEFFCRNEIKIRKKSGSIVPFVWNRPQRRLAKLILGHWHNGSAVKVIVLKARQWGCTTLIASFMVWVTTQNAAKTGQVLAQDDDSTGSILEIYEIMFEGLSDLVKPSVDRSNRKLGLFFTNRSAIRVKTAGTKATSKKVGRSKTNQINHNSEVAFWEDPGETMRAVRQTNPLTAFCAMFDESTPNGAGGKFYETWQLAKSGKSSYHAFFVPFYEIEEYEDKVTDAQIELWRKYKKTKKDSIRRQLGLHVDALRHSESNPDATLGNLMWWNRCLMDKCDGDIDTMYQEYPWDDVSCFLASGRPAFNPADIRWISGHIHAANRLDVFRSASGRFELVSHPNGVWRMWEPVDEDGKYIVSADICSGYAPLHGQDKLDRTAIGVFRRLPGGSIHMVAMYSGRPEPDEVGDLMMDIGSYYNKAVLAPEVNSYGVATIERIRKEMYPNIYIRTEYSKVTGKWQRNQMGWYTSVTTRPAMIAATKQKLRKHNLIVHDDECVAEMTALIHNDKNNKIEAPPGGRDDMAIMVMIACQVDNDLTDLEQKGIQVNEPTIGEAARSIKAWDERDKEQDGGLIHEDLMKRGYYDYPSFRKPDFF